MRKLFVMTIAAVGLSATGALAQDEPCGDIDALGICEGAEALFCVNDVLQRVNCADLVGDGSVVGVCEVYEGFGSWCGMPDGGGCLFQSDQGTVGFACETDDSGCVDGVCTPGIGVCTPAAEAVQSCLDGTNLSIG